jgi:small multidrug resistance pump
MHWIYLTIAILSEVIATSSLKAADGFTRWAPSLIVVIGYSASFYFLSLTLRTLSVGVAYAIWSGVGVALVSLIGWTIYNQSLSLATFIGITFICVGVVVLTLFSKTVSH